MPSTLGLARVAALIVGGAFWGVLGARSNAPPHPRIPRALDQRAAPCTSRC